MGILFLFERLLCHVKKLIRLEKKFLQKEEKMFRLERKMVPYRIKNILSQLVRFCVWNLFSWVRDSWMSIRGSASIFFKKNIFESYHVM